MRVEPKCALACNGGLSRGGCGCSELTGQDGGPQQLGVRHAVPRSLLVRATRLRRATCMRSLDHSMHIITSPLSPLPAVALLAGPAHFSGCRYCLAMRRTRAKKALVATHDMWQAGNHNPCTTLVGVYTLVSNGHTFSQLAQSKVAAEECVQTDPSLSGRSCKCVKDVSSNCAKTSASFLKHSFFLKVCEGTCVSVHARSCNMDGCLA